MDNNYSEYQIERLQIYGEENPHTGLKNKVKRFQFKQSLDIVNPVTKEVDKKPLKPFMISQLQIAFERSRVILSPFDEVLHKQLVDYQIIRKNLDGSPVFTSKDEHFVDALGLAYLGFVLEFPEIVNVIKQVEYASITRVSTKRLGGGSLNQLFDSIETSAVPEGFAKVMNYDKSDLPGDRPTTVSLPLGYRSSMGSGSSWGSRSSRNRSSSGNMRSSW